MIDIPILKCPLFSGIAQQDLSSILNCVGAKKLHFSKGSYIWNAGDNAEFIGIVLEGQVNIIKEDFLGNRTVIANILTNQIFGESFSIAEAGTYPVSVQAAQESTILLIITKNVALTCEKACEFHSILINNLLKLTAQKNIKLSTRIDCITKKTTRQKLLYYLVNEMQMNMKHEIFIPFNRDELADYLGVNRSALSRELSMLFKEGIISFEKNCFKLLSIEKLQDVIEY